MAVRLDIAAQCVEIVDLGVTIRTILAVAAQGYELNGRRRWQVKYKGVMIGSFQVSTPKSSQKAPTKTSKD